MTSDDLPILRALIDQRPDWFDRAACRGLGPDLFYPDTVGPNVGPAKAICAGCPVRQECLERGLDASEGFGVWGGLSPKERRPLRNRRTELKPPTHGTTAGYHYHHTRRDLWGPPCAACRQAHSLRMAERRRLHECGGRHTNSDYIMGCRCDGCRRAHTEYKRNGGRAA